MTQQKEIICLNDIGSCKRAICECDKQLAIDLSKHEVRWVYQHWRTHSTCIFSSLGRSESRVFFVRKALVKIETRDLALRFNYCNFYSPSQAGVLSNCELNFNETNDQS